MPCSSFTVNATECMLTFVNANTGVCTTPIHLQCMNALLLRRLFLMAIVAGAGLLALQAYWMHKEWNNTTDVLQRQVDYSFQTAIDSELANRKNILRGYLETILSDTSVVGFGTKYNEKDGKWMITMFDAKNKKDYSAWTNADMPVGPELTEQQKKAIIHHYVYSNVGKNIEEDVIFFYTQRFGSMWSEKYKQLSLDSINLHNLFAKQLNDKNIHSTFTIKYVDTSKKQTVGTAPANALIAKATGINYASVNDYHRTHLALAYVYNPIALLFGRLWLALAATIMLLSLTFYCLYRMYKTILQQKQLHVLKNDFISNMTHELKTPVATVTAAIDALQYFNGFDSREKAERYLNTSRGELQRLNDIVNKVLDISVYEQQQTALHKQTIDIAQLFKEAVQAFEVKGTVFSYSIHCEPEGLTVLADKTHLQNVLYNLTDNAVKYGGDNLQLRFAACKKEDAIIITVQDNGTGIEEKHLPHIFDKFYRVPQGNVHNVKGFGLGLFYVRQIIMQHGGNIAVTSNRQAGTIFTIKLPVN